MSDEDGKPTRVMVVDDNQVVRWGLVSLLEASGEVAVVAEAGDGQRAIEIAPAARPDLVLLDVRMPLVDGVEAAEPLSRIAPVVMLTHSDDPETVRSAIRAGACGYLVHGQFSPEELARAVRDGVSGAASPMSAPAVRAMMQAVRGMPETPPAPGVDHAVARAALGLSEREGEVMGLMARGCSNPEIAAELFLTEKTVKNNVTRIYAKLGVDSRGAAIARWHGTGVGLGQGGAR